MKIVSWNCNGGLRNKVKLLDTLDADVFIIQECEDPKESTEAYREWAGDYLWVGTSKHKGIGVFPKHGHSVNPLAWNGSFKIQGLNTQDDATQWTTSDLKLFLPFKINEIISVLGVWTKGNSSQSFGYMGQFWKYLQIHREQIAVENILIVGDFNSNAIWDKQDRWWNHSSVVAELKQVGIRSLYHHQEGEAQGQETVPTFFHHRNRSKPYHIDYAFCSSDILAKAHLRIGEKDEWLEASDHMPLSINL